MDKLYKKIFIIDDSREDIFFFKEACRANELIHKVRSFDDSLEFIDFSREGNSFSNLPDLIILDLNMPKVSGFSVIQELRDNDRYRNIPIIMLSSTSNQTEVYESYNLGANFFIRKPLTFKEWIQVVETIDKVWLEVC